MGERPPVNHGWHKATAAVWRRVSISPRGMRELDAWRAITPRLRVLYLLPHHNLTGGMKMLVGQLSALRARGHAV